MVLYRVEYKKHGTIWWSKMCNFTSLNDAVVYAEERAEHSWHQDTDLRIIKVTTTAEEIRTWAKEEVKE